jgi:hypothetical protein
MSPATNHSADVVAPENHNSISPTPTSPKVTKRLKLVAANINLMPQGILSFFTTGSQTQRASDLADFMLGNVGQERGGVFTKKDNSDSVGDIIFLQELYDDASRNIIFEKFKTAGYVPVDGPGAGRKCYYYT